MSPALPSPALPPLVPDVLPRNPARREDHRRGARHSHGLDAGALRALLDSIGEERLYALFPIAAY